VADVYLRLLAMFKRLERTEDVYQLGPRNINAKPSRFVWQTAANQSSEIYCVYRVSKQPAQPLEADCLPECRRVDLAPEKGRLVNLLASVHLEFTANILGSIHAGSASLADRFSLVKTR
jgi:hypothetical protein